MAAAAAFASPSTVAPSQAAPSAACHRCSRGYPVIAAAAPAAAAPPRRSRTRPAAPSSASSPTAIFRTTRSTREVDASVRDYYREVGLFDVLSDDEVIHCAKRVAKLSAWEELHENLSAQFGRAPTTEEWADACRDAEPTSDDSAPIPAAQTMYWFRSELRSLRAAKDRLVSANLRLVVCIARKYANNGVSLPDLIQEGSLGLIRGAERFDPAKGFRFATYAAWWIRQSIQRSISRSSRVIRLPAGVGDISKRVARARKMLSNELMREPTNEELAEELGVTRARLEFIVKKTAETATISLHTPVVGGEATTIGDLLETQTATPEETVTTELLRGDLESVLLNLSPREREVVRLRYGFDDGRTKNYDEIGSLYCVPGDRIRQIERRAMRKLRHPTLNSVLRDYLK